MVVRLQESGWLILLLFNNFCNFDKLPFAAAKCKDDSKSGIVIIGDPTAPPLFKRFMLELDNP